MKSKSAKIKKASLVNPVESVILHIRGQKVILDSDLAFIYGVTTKRLNEQVSRNNNRFPKDFIFQLTVHEKNEVVANCDHLESLKFSNTTPWAFTEHGAIMAANILNSVKAVKMSVAVVRAFIQMREAWSSTKILSEKLKELEKKISGHDENIILLFKTLQQLLEDAPKKIRKIGFVRND